MSNKIPNQFSDLELLKLLEDTTVKEKSVIDDPAISSPIKFLTLFNILPGQYKVKTTALYSLYKQWAGKTAGSQRYFVLHVKNYLPHGLKTGTFSIKETALNLSARFAQEVLKPKKKHTNKHLKKHIDKFIAEFDLKRGDIYIDIDDVHSRYWMWAAKKGRKQKIPLAQFQSIMRLYCNVITNQHGKVMIGFQKYGEKKEENKKES